MGDLVEPAIYFVEVIMVFVLHVDAVRNFFLPVPI